MGGVPHPVGIPGSCGRRPVGRGAASLRIGHVPVPPLVASVNPVNHLLRLRQFSARRVARGGGVVPGGGGGGSFAAPFGAVTPWLTEEFNYADETAFINGTIYSNEDPFNSDTSTNILASDYVYPGKPHSYKGLYAAQPSNCADYTPCGRNINLPTTVQEVWTQTGWKFSSGFTTVNTGAGCSSGNAQKLFFGRVHGTSRFQVIAGSNGGQIWETGYPGNEEPVAGEVPTSTFNLDQFADDTTVVDIKTHWKIAASGVVCEMWMQNQKVISLSGDSTAATDIYGLIYLRNLNQGPPTDQYIRLLYLYAWNTDPGFP